MAKGFERFIGGEKGSVKKEKIRQEKKQIRKEKQEFFEQKKKEAKLQRQQRQEPDPEKTSYRGNIKRTNTAKDPSERAGRSKDNPGKVLASRVPEKASTSSRTATGKPVLQKPVRKGSIKKDEEIVIPEAPKYTTLKPTPVLEQMPLNKYVAHAGICSRRDAAELVRSGKITVNGRPITEPGFKILKTDEVKFNGKKITARKNLVYILLNKPKDYITTTEDPEGRKTVLDIIKHATTERVYPVGRLDRNTTGVLLFTNDGDLAQKLSHPSYQIKKIYEVRLDKSMARKDMESMMEGITLEDGFIKADAVAYADSKDKSVIGVEIHSGRNRIVRRMFEHLGYDVRNLDRVMFANLTKKNVERGKWRFLSEKEVRLLKFMNASYGKVKSKK